MTKIATQSAEETPQTCRPVDGVVLRQLLEDGISIGALTGSIEYFLEPYTRGSKFGLSEPEILQEMFLQAFQAGFNAALDSSEAIHSLSAEEIEAASIKLASCFRPCESGSSPS